MLQVLILDLSSEFGEFTPDLHSVIQTGWMSMFIGGIYGGTLEGRNAYEKFIKANVASKFHSHFEAKVTLLCSLLN